MTTQIYPSLMQLELFPFVWGSKNVTDVEFRRLSRNTSMRKIVKKIAQQMFTVFCERSPNVVNQQKPSTKVTADMLDESIKAQFKNYDGQTE